MTRPSIGLALVCSLLTALSLAAQGSVESMRVRLAAAARGSAAAQYSLGASAEREGNFALALTWYRLAANNGYAGAEYNLGLMLEAGRGTEPDLGEARRWYRQAAGLKFGPAVAKVATFDQPGATSVPTPSSPITYARDSWTSRYMTGASAAVALALLLVAGIGLRLLFAWIESSRAARNAAVARAARRKARG